MNALKRCLFVYRYEIDVCENTSAARSRGEACCFLSLGQPHFHDGAPCNEGIIHHGGTLATMKRLGSGIPINLMAF